MVVSFYGANINTKAAIKQIKSEKNKRAVKKLSYLCRVEAEK
jgi:hypothetical protein